MPCFGAECLSRNQVTLLGFLILTHIGIKTTDYPHKQQYYPAVQQYMFRWL